MTIRWYGKNQSINDFQGYKARLYHKNIRINDKAYDEILRKGTQRVLLGINQESRAILIKPEESESGLKVSDSKNIACMRFMKEVARIFSLEFKEHKSLVVAGHWDDKEKYLVFYLGGEENGKSS